jgi:hypothetical protein
VVEFLQAVQRYLKKREIAMFKKGSSIEYFLETTMSVRWDWYDDFTFDALIPEWWVDNLGRSPLTANRDIDSYRQRMKDGSVAPGPILWMDPRLKAYRVLDGTRRMLAAKSLTPMRFSGYRVLTESRAVANCIRVMSNRCLLGGMQESEEWTMANAIGWLVDTGEATIEDVARWGGWTVPVLKDKQAVLHCGFRIRQIGGPEKFSDALVRVFNKYAQVQDFKAAPQPLAAFFGDVKTLRWKPEDVDIYAEEFFSVQRTKGRLHEQFAGKLKEWRADPDVKRNLENPGRKSRTPLTDDVKVLKGLRSLKSIVNAIARRGTKLPMPMDEHFHLYASIGKSLKQVESNSRKKR